uniref:ABC transporter permease n=1 Tax=Candidatus Methanarcanum hacksteinii TaxID=2911857 RepID=UPI0037DD1AA9
MSDTNAYKETDSDDKFNLKHTSMSFPTALKLSFNNIKSKKGSTFLTALASSIGIIGIAVILSLSSGFQNKIDAYQEEALAEFPIIITQSAMEVDMEKIGQMHSEMMTSMTGLEEYQDYDEVYLYDPSDFTMVHTNKLTDEYIDYLEAIDSSICQSIGYTRIVNMNLIRKVDDRVVPVSISSGMTSGGSGNMGGMGLSSYPTTLGENNESYLEKNYDLLAGTYPTDEKGMVLVVDSKNRIDVSVMEHLGFDTSDMESIAYEDLVGLEFKLISNDVFYIKSPYGNFVPNMNYASMYDSQDNITLTLQGIVRQKKDVSLAVLGSGIAYSDDLTKLVIEMSKDSEIVHAQEQSNRNVITLEEIDEQTKQTYLSYFGADGIPYMITLYPTNFDNKDAVVEYLDMYNDAKSSENAVLYTDLASTITSMTKGIMNGITIVLIAFAAISVVVSIIMICIITYASVVERTKEIGILKALGARKKDITRVFDAETFILGVFSGALGIGIA